MTFSKMDQTHLRVPDQIAARLGLEKIGWVYTGLPRDELLNSSEVVEIAAMQELFSTNKHYSGYRLSTFLSVIVRPDPEQGGQPDTKVGHCEAGSGPSVLVHAVSFGGRWRNGEGRWRTVLSFLPRMTSSRVPTFDTRGANFEHRPLGDTIIAMPVPIWARKPLLLLAPPAPRHDFRWINDKSTTTRTFNNTTRPPTRQLRKPLEMVGAMASPGV